MSGQPICFDKQFLKDFQAEKNEMLQNVRKEAFHLLKDAQSRHQGESLEAVNEFFQLYMDKDAMANQDQQADVDSILEQTQALLAEGRTTKEIARIIKLDRVREAQRLARANAQRKLETLLTKDSSTAQTLVPLIESMKHAADVEARVTLVGFGMLLLINSLGERFATAAPKIVAQLSVKMIDDPDWVEGFHAIRVDALVPDLTLFFIKDLRRAARFGRSTVLPSEFHSGLERLAQHLEEWLTQRGSGTTLVYRDAG